MYVSVPLETQIILIILHKISFSFPNLALVHALTAAHGGLLLFLFWILFFLRKLLTRALAGYCAKATRVLLRRQTARRGRQESIAPAARRTRPPLSLTSYLSPWKGARARARRPGAVGGCERQAASQRSTDATRWSGSRSGAEPALPPGNAPGTAQEATQP